MYLTPSSNRSARTSSVTRWPTLAAALFCFVCLLDKTATAQENGSSSAAPSDAYAMVYSRTALELFFTPESGRLTHITHNGSDRGVTDARSLWLDGLNPSIEHVFQLRSVAIGSSAVPSATAAVITVYTGDFNPPVYRVDASNDVVDAPSSIPLAQNASTVSGEDDTVSVVPSNAYALIYSSSAVELFFTPASGQLTHITHNGLDRGVTTGRSLWLDGLDSSIEHVFQLRSVADGSSAAPTGVAAIITVYMADFSPPVYRVDAINGFADAASPIASAQNSSIAPPPPETVPEPETVSAPAATPQPVVSVSTETVDASAMPMVAAAQSNACNVTSVAELIACAQEASRYDLINVRVDLHCQSGNCCPSGNALMNLRSVQRLVIEGNGKRLLRSSSHRQCGLLDIVGGSDITLQNWVLDEDISVTPCQVDDNCPRALHVRNASNITLNNITVTNGKAYTIYVDQVDGFQFTNSRLINSGVLGLYIGHGDRPSTRVLVENSTFIDNQTNALALLGVVGNDVSTNRVVNNRFLRNHRRGQWQVAPQYGQGFTGGGQVYLAKSSGVTFENNEISDGYCENCFVQTRARSGVTGLELGIPGQPTVSLLNVRGNTIVNHDGFGIHSNVNSQLPSSVRVEGNRLLSNYIGVSLTGGQESNNQIQDTRWFQSFEGGNDLVAHFDTDRSCPGSAIERVCGQGDSRYGSCTAKVSTSSSACHSQPATLKTKPQNVSTGQSVQAAAWVGGTSGQWCLVFANNTTVTDSRCQPLTTTDASTVGPWAGTPNVVMTAPSGTNRVWAELRVMEPNSTVTIDDVKLSFD